MNIRLAVAAAVATLGLFGTIGCGSPTHAATASVYDDTDSEFLKNVHNFGVEGGDLALIHDANAVCNMLQVQGSTKAQIVSVMQQHGNLDVGRATLFVTEAIQTYCPRW
jgi:hypothetical protein